MLLLGPIAVTDLGFGRSSEAAQHYGHQHIHDHGRLHGNERRQPPPNRAGLVRNYSK